MSAPRQKSIENGKLHVLSPSLLNAFDDSSAFGCQRRGWFKYVKGLPEPTTDAMTRGTHLHAMNEEYLKTGKLLLGTPEQTAWFNAGRHFLDVLRTGFLPENAPTLIEAPLPADFAVYGVPVSPMSKCDVVTEAGIIDWKTTSDVEKYGKTPGQLAKDVQMLIYAMAFHPTAERVVLTHGQYQTKGRVRFHASSVELTRNELDTNYERVINPLVEKVKAVAAVTDVNEVTPNRNACRTCPHSAVCPTEKASIIMSIFDRLKKSQLQAAAVSAPAEKTTFVAIDGSILPPDAPKSDPAKAAEPVEGFSPVPPPRREVKNLIVDAAPSPSADLAHDVHDGVKTTLVGRVEAEKVIVTDERREPVTEPEKKRGPGRPPGAKNKAKEAPAEVVVNNRALTATEIAVMEANQPLPAIIVPESVTVTYGLTINIGDYNSVRVDCSMTSRFSGDADAAYKATLAKVVGYVEAEAQKVQSAIAEKQSVKK